MADDKRNDLQRVVDELSFTYTVEGCCIWLNATQDWWRDGVLVTRSTALEAIHNGHAELVLVKAQSLTGMVAT